MKLVSLVFGGFSLICTFANADIHPDAPPETHQFASLLGSWEIDDYQLGADGNWQAGAGANWHWYTILDGFAIQDDWVAPILDAQGKITRYQHGTNIRTYNPQKKRWEMAWISNTGQQVDTFTATKVDNTIVMSGVFNGRDAKITFYDLKQDSFQWKLEFKSDKGEWSEVYRISGKRI